MAFTPTQSYHSLAAQSSLQAVQRRFSPFISSGSWHNQAVVWSLFTPGAAAAASPAATQKSGLGRAGCTAVWSVVAQRSLHCSPQPHCAITAGPNSNEEISLGIVIRALHGQHAVCCLLSAACCLLTRRPAPPPAPTPLHCWPGLLSPNWTDAGAHYWPGWLHCNSNLFDWGRHTALSSSSAGSVFSQCYLCCAAALFVY